MNRWSWQIIRFLALIHMRTKWSRSWTMHFWKALSLFTETHRFENWSKHNFGKFYTPKTLRYWIKGSCTNFWDYPLFFIYYPIVYLYGRRKCMWSPKIRPSRISRLHTISLIHPTLARGPKTDVCRTQCGTTCLGCICNVTYTRS